MKIVQPSVTLMSHTPDPEKLIELTGRTCWKSEPKGEDSHVKFIKMIKGKNHASVLEHASITFRIVTDRAIANEIVRHRIASFSQESTRYVCYEKERHGGEVSFVCPSAFDNEESRSLFSMWVDACEFAESAYLELVNYGASPQNARSVLPLCTKTELVMTINFRSLLNFLELRTSKAAHPDMVVIANKIKEICVQVAPNVFGE